MASPESGEKALHLESDRAMVDAETGDDDDTNNEDDETAELLASLPLAFLQGLQEERNRGSKGPAS